MYHLIFSLSKSMKTNLIVALFLLTRFWVAQAQASVAANVVKNDSLIKITAYQNGRYSHLLYSLDDEPITNATLKQVLAKYPESAAELHKYRAQKRNTLLLLPVFVAATVVGGTQADQHRDTPGSAFSKAPVPFSIALGAFFGSIVMGAANTHFEKAIEAYNRRRHAQLAAR